MGYRGEGVTHSEHRLRAEEDEGLRAEQRRWLEKQWWSLSTTRIADEDFFQLLQCRWWSLQIFQLLHLDEERVKSSFFVEKKKRVKFVSENFLSVIIFWQQKNKIKLLKFEGSANLLVPSRILEFFFVFLRTFLDVVNSISFV